MTPRLVSLALLAVTALAQPPPPEFDFREAPVPGSDPLPYVVYEPRNLAPAGRYPLVVYLHGSCGECVTHERILKESGLQLWHGYEGNEQREPTFLFAPAGGAYRQGGGWTSEPRRGVIFSLIDGLVEEYPIDPERIYLMGFSMGGAGVWNYLQARPGFFAAANAQAIGGGEVDAEAVKDTPIWATIGVDDQANRIEQLTANIARIRAANGDPRGAAPWVTGVNPRFAVFPGANHGAAQGRTQRMPSFLDWFYGQVNDGNTPPNVRFVRPVPSPEPYPRDVGATVAATDADGRIRRVDFYLDDERVAVDRDAPFEYVYKALPLGERALGATAIDDKGKQRRAEVRVRVGAE